MLDRGCVQSTSGRRCNLLGLAPKRRQARAAASCSPVRRRFEGYNEDNCMFNICAVLRLGSSNLSDVFGCVRARGTDGDEWGTFSYS